MSARCSLLAVVLGLTMVAAPAAAEAHAPPGTIPTAPVFGTASTVWLRMVKQGPRYSTSYSTNGTDFTPIYATGAALMNVKVGLFAFNGPATSSDLGVAFDDFQVTNDEPHHHRR
jgi:hypothetical protein